MNTLISSNPSKEPSALPAKWEKLCGILRGVADENDERFNYIINK